MLALAGLKRSRLSPGICANGFLRSVGWAMSCSQVDAPSTIASSVNVGKTATLQLYCNPLVLHSQCMHTSAEHARSQSLPGPAGMPLPTLNDSLVEAILFDSMSVQRGSAVGASTAVPQHAFQMMTSQEDSKQPRFVAKRYGQSSVLGSYLDPLADKALIGCVVGALGYQGSLPLWLVALIIGRDVVLLGGAFVHRFQKVGWRWPGAAEFFRVSSSLSTLQSQPHPSEHSTAPSTAQRIHSTSQHATSSTGSSDDHGNKPQGTDKEADQSVDASIAAIGDIGSSSSQQQHAQQKQESSGQDQEAAANVQSIQPAAFVQPLYISKVNTCFQLLLVGGCLTSSWYAWPPQEVLFSIGVITGGTTLASTAAYARAYIQGKIK